MRQCNKASVYQAYCTLIYVETVLLYIRIKCHPPQRVGLCLGRHPQDFTYLPVSL